MLKKSLEALGFGPILLTIDSLPWPVRMAVYALLGLVAVVLWRLVKFTLLMTWKLIALPFKMLFSKKSAKSAHVSAKAA